MDARHLEEFRRREDEFVEMVLKARVEALSHRKFNVAALAFAVNDKGEYGIFKGVNMKIFADKERRTCAEQVAFLSARANGYRNVIGFVVSGPPQPDQQSHKKTLTLHPCVQCREDFSAAFDVDPEIRVVTVDPFHPDVREWFSLFEACVTHDHAPPR